MTRYLSDFRLRDPRGGLHPYIQLESEPMASLADVFEAIAENHVAEDRTRGFRENVTVPGGVFRCFRLELDEGTFRDVTEDVLEAYRLHVLAETGAEPWFLRTVGEAA